MPMISSQSRTSTSSGVNAINLCKSVRESCRDWYDEQQQSSNNAAVPAPAVRVDAAALNSLALDIAQQQTNTKVEWDKEGWHYHPPADWPLPIRRERIALYILALDAINFCFWPSRCDGIESTNTATDDKTETADTKESKAASYVYEYEHLASQMTVMAQADHATTQAADLTRVSADYVFAAASLRNMTESSMREWFQIGSSTNLVPPNLSQRCALWRQVGTVLMEQFEGSAWNLIQQANGSAVRAVQLLFDSFEGFRDVAVVNTSPASNNEKNDEPKTVYFLKRAQICVGDWHAALDGHLLWDDMDQLTTFADYRLPQLLRERGVLVYDKDLARAVDQQDELVEASVQEVSIRAATVMAVDALVEALNRSSNNSSSPSATTTSTKKPWTAVSVDWYLWQVGERLEAQGKLAPHHCVRTIYY